MVVVGRPGISNTPGGSVRKRIPSFADTLGKLGTRESPGPCLSSSTRPPNNYRADIIARNFSNEKHYCREESRRHHLLNSEFWIPDSWGSLRRAGSEPAESAKFRSAEYAVQFGNAGRIGRIGKLHANRSDWSARFVLGQKHRFPHGRGSAPLPNRERKRPVAGFFHRRCDTIYRWPPGRSSRFATT